MSDIDWSKAPEGATHCDPSCDCWYMRSDTWLYFDRGIWCVTVDKTGSWQNILTPRPFEWRGPQDGLPPVGMEVDCYRSGSDWLRGTVVAHVQRAHRKRAIFQGDIGQWWSGAEGNFRPIQSDRDKAIKEMTGEIIYPIGHEETVIKVCLQLYDAGYRKESLSCSTK